MEGRFGESGRDAEAFEVIGQVAVRDGAVGRIGQLVAKGEGATLLGDPQGYVSLLVEQVGKAAENFAMPSGMVLEKLEASFQLGAGLAEAAENSQYGGTVEP